jgi:hypothetical protein
MFPNIGVLLCIGVAACGMKGFTKEGIPFTRKKTIKGNPAKIVGAGCITIAFLLLILILAGFVMSQMRM